MSEKPYRDVETGSICEAHKLNQAVTRSICVVRDAEKSKFKVLTPCGVCQERFLYWGENVKAAVYSASGELIFKSLKEVQSYHWSHACPNANREVPNAKID